MLVVKCQAGLTLHSHLLYGLKQRGEGWTGTRRGQQGNSSGYRPWWGSH